MQYQEVRRLVLVRARHTHIHTYPTYRPKSHSFLGVCVCVCVSARTATHFLPVLLPILTVPRVTHRTHTLVLTTGLITIFILVISVIGSVGLIGCVRECVRAPTPSLTPNFMISLG